MAMVAGWSSIPSDLLNRVADGLLATGDVDCYVSLRAVCHHWRHATAAPSGTDRRFLPLRWVMLGFDAGNFHGFFLNVDTGRLLWKDLPALRDYAYITKDNDGLLILQGTKNSTDNFSALNPFTGVSISFPLRYPACGRAFAAGSSPEVTLQIFQDQQRFTRVDLNSQFANQYIFWAKPASLESFASVASFQGRVYAMDRNGTIVSLDGQQGITTVIPPDGWQEARGWRPSFLVDNSGELLIIHVPWLGDSMQVFRVDLENQVVRRINGIGNRAIFLGNRSLSTYADSLPTVEANCIYYRSEEPPAEGARDLHALS
jgi:hypothetical protein